MFQTDTFSIESGHSKGLSSTGIKLLALALMVLDHIHYFFGFTGATPEWFMWLGRLSAWLFLFAVAEGFAHTHDRRKYALRIWLMGAGMGAVNLLLTYFGRRGDGFYPETNIFATITLLLVYWQGMDWLKARKFAPGLAAFLVPVMLLIGFAKLPPTIQPYAYFAECTVLPLPTLTEGGIFTLLGGLLLYPLRNHRKWQAGALAAFIVGWNLVLGLMMGMSVSMIFREAIEWFGAFAAIPMLMYNGQRGRGLKRLFYVFYPAHVYLFYALSLVVYALLNRG